MGAAQTKGICSLWGSASSISSERPSPLKMMPNLWETPGFMMHSDAVDLRDRPGHLLAEPLRDRSLDPARPPVHDDAVPDCGEVASRRYVPRPEVHVEPQHFEYAPAYLELQGVVSEEAQVARPAAGRDADAHGDRAAEASPLHGQAVHIRLLRRLQGRHGGAVRVGDVAEAVEHEEDDLVVVREDDRPSCRLPVLFVEVPSGSPASFSKSPSCFTLTVFQLKQVIAKIGPIRLDRVAFDAVERYVDLVHGKGAARTP